MEAQERRPVAVITGASSGLGMETANALAKRGMKVILGCRSMDGALEAYSKIKEDGMDVDVRIGPPLDLCRLESVLRFAKEIMEENEHVDVLVNNAGAPNGSDALRERKKSGKESMHVEYEKAHPLARSNVLGAHALTRLLIPQIQSSGRGRVVNVTSVMHRLAKLETAEGLFKKCDYGQTKLANVLFTFELQRRFGIDVDCVAVDPGGVRTGIWKKNKNLSQFAKGVVNWCYAPAEEAAQLVAYAATADLPDGALGNGNHDKKLRLLARGAFAWPMVTRGPLQVGSFGSLFQNAYALMALLPASLLDHPFRMIWKKKMEKPWAVCAAPDAYDREAARDLWEASERVIFGQ